jgi:hypothetical protein
MAGSEGGGGGDAQEADQMGGNVADSDIDGHDAVEQSGRMAGQQGEAVGDGSFMFLEVQSVSK